MKALMRDAGTESSSGLVERGSLAFEYVNNHCSLG